VNTLQKFVGKVVKAVDEKAYITSRRRVIDTWDFTILKRWMVQNNVYPASAVNEAEVEYKRFLTMYLLCPDVILPVSNEVDPFWHSHILFTEDYIKMSDMVFGKYLIHRPAILDSQHMLDGLFQQNTMVKYQEIFGTLNLAYWGSACCAGGCCR
jgi:hypothetical protein